MVYRRRGGHRWVGEIVHEPGKDMLMRAVCVRLISLEQFATLTRCGPRFIVDTWCYRLEHRCGRGEAAVAYNQAQAKWDKASQELNTVLATISKTVSQGNDAMSDVNRRAAASWG